jgi:hypothetical protein
MQNDFSAKLKRTQVDAGNGNVSRIVSYRLLKDKKVSFRRTVKAEEKSVAAAQNFCD